MVFLGKFEKFVYFTDGEIVSKFKYGQAGW